MFKKKVLLQRGKAIYVNVIYNVKKANSIKWRRKIIYLPATLIYQHVAKRKKILLIQQPKQKISFHSDTIGFVHSHITTMYNYQSGFRSDYLTDLIKHNTQK